MSQYTEEMKSMWFKGVLLSTLVFLSIEIYSKTKYKDRINEITFERFNLALL